MKRRSFLKTLSATVIISTGLLPSNKIPLIHSNTGPLFVLDNSDIYSPDNGSTVIVDTRGRRWKRLRGQEYPNHHIDELAWFSANG